MYALCTPFPEAMNMNKYTIIKEDPGTLCCLGNRTQQRKQTEEVPGAGALRQTLRESSPHQGEMRGIKVKWRLS